MSEEVVGGWMPRAEPRATTYPPAVLSLVLPCVITYLVHLPNSRALRLGIWAALTVCVVWTILTIKTDSTIPLPWLVLHFYSSATRWAVSRSPPAYQPLSRPPPFPPARLFRHTTLFKSLDLLCNESRLINIAPYSPPLRATTTSWLRYTAYHVAMSVVHLIMYDLVTLPLALLAPKGVGDPLGHGADYGEFLTQMWRKYGVPEVLVRVLCTAGLGFTIHGGMALMFHMFAMLGVGSGVWSGEEWPKLMHKPWLSTSLSELWGKRYHQTLRHVLILFSTPLLFLPPLLHPIIIFLVSAIYHHVLSYPTQFPATLYPYIQFFMLSALGVIAERMFLRLTGKRVGGSWGRLWTWSFLFVSSQRVVTMWMENGWAGHMRGDLAKGGISPVEWALYALGLGADPRIQRDLWVQAGDWRLRE